MKKRTTGPMLATSAALGLAAAACSSGGGSTPASAASPAKLTACPQSAAPALPAGAAQAIGASLPMAKTIKASDTSNSILIDPSGPQIQCGRTLLATYSNVTYATPVTNGQKTSLKLDIQVPETAGDKPLVIYITGGGFVQADRTGHLNQRTYLAEQGNVVASIQYRTTAQGAIYSDGVADVKSAVRYLRAHAAEYHINASKVAVWGQSAGGYLAAMTGTTNGLKQFDTGANLGQSSNVQAVVDEFGPSDLSRVAADYDTATQKANYAPGNSLAQYVLGPGTKKSILDDPAAVAAANPVTYISSATPPFVELHGTHDQLVSPSQTSLVDNALRAKGVTSTRYLLKGANHGDLTFTGNTKAALPWSTEKVMGLIVTFLRHHLGS